MKKFHRNLNIMSLFTAVLLVGIIMFWPTFINIAITNIILNGIILGVTIFGIGLCFVNMFRLLPEYKWLHAYFDAKPTNGFVPKLLRPVAMALHNRHMHVNTSTLTQLLELVTIRIDDERENVRYITNTLIFLGLLGTFWGLILTVGGFADLIMNLDFADEDILQNMQIGLSGPLTGMATAFTSSLLGLAGSLAVGFLGLQLQFAQNTVYQDLSDYMTKYILEKPTNTPKIVEIATKAPVNANVYTKITDIYNAFVDADYEIKDLIRIDGKYPAVIAIGTNEQLFLGTVNLDEDVLQDTLKRIELCFADTLDGIKIHTRILCVDGTKSGTGNDIIHFATTDSLTKYISQHQNTAPKTHEDKADFEAYSEYIGVVIEYLFKPQK